MNSRSRKIDQHLYSDSEGFVKDQRGNYDLTNGYANDVIIANDYREVRGNAPDVIPPRRQRITGFNEEQKPPKYISKFNITTTGSNVIGVKVENNGGKSYIYSWGQILHGPSVKINDIKYESGIIFLKNKVYMVNVTPEEINRYTRIYRVDSTEPVDFPYRDALGI